MTLDFPILPLATGALIISHFLFKITLKKLRTKVPIHGVPMVPDSHWLLGHWRIIVLDFKIKWRRLSFDHANKDGLSSFWIGAQPAVSINVAKTARKMLSSGSLKPNLPHATKHMKKLAGENSLLHMNGDEWKANRNAFTSALSGKGLKKMYQPIRSVANTLSKTIMKNISLTAADATDVDIMDIFRMVTTDILGKTILGLDFNCCNDLKQTNITKAIEFLMQEFNERFSSPLNPQARFYSFPCERNRRFDQALQLARSTIKDSIKKRTTCSEPNDKKTDLIWLLYQALKASGGSENIEEIVIDMVMTTYLASYDSTTTTLVYIFYSIATNPSIENLCLEEINRSLERNCNELDPDELPYCSAVVTETIRLYPVFPVTFRALEKPYKVGEVTLPTGVSLFVPIWEIQRDARNYPRPTEFIPERWVKRSKEDSPEWIRRTHDDGTPGGIAAGNNDAYLAFSAGGRNCVGQKLARAETCIIFAEVLRNVKFELKPSYELNPVLSGAVQKPKGGMPMTVRQRN